VSVPLIGGVMSVVVKNNRQWKCWPVDVFDPLGLCHFLHVMHFISMHVSCCYRSSL
jgi:hypothetical protein